MIVWKVATGEAVWRADDLGVVAALAVDPKGEVLAVAAGRTVHLYRLRDGHRINSLDSDSRVSAVTLSADGNWVVIGTDGGPVVVWDWHADGPRHTLLGHTNVD